MDVKKKKRLSKKGWTCTSVQDFLELTPNEMTHIEQKEYTNLISPSKEKSAPSA